MPVVKLTTHRVEKPWGRHDLAPLFEDQPAGQEPVGEIWYEDPAGTPREVIAILHRNFVRALEHTSVKVSIGAEGAQAGGNTPEEFAAFIRSETEKYAGIIKSARLTPGS